MGYNAFARADAARIGVPRAMLTVDAKALDILLAKPEMADVRSQLRFDGDLRMSPAAGSDGFGVRPSRMRESCLSSPPGE